MAKRLSLRSELVAIGRKIDRVLRLDQQIARLKREQAVVLEEFKRRSARFPSNVIRQFKEFEYQWTGGRLQERRRTMSAAARKKVSDAQKKRWAKKRAKKE